MGDEPIQVVIADDHAAYRTSLAVTLEAEHDFLVIGLGESAEDAVTLASDLAPDIILLDLNMPGGGLPAASRIATSRPDIKIVFLTASDDETTIDMAHKLGARGYIRKGISARELIRLLRAIQSETVGWIAPEPTKQWVRSKHVRC